MPRPPFGAVTTAAPGLPPCALGGRRHGRATRDADGAVPHAGGVRSVIQIPAPAGVSPCADGKANAAKAQVGLVSGGASPRKDGKSNPRVSEGVLGW